MLLFGNGVTEVRSQLVFDVSFEDLGEIESFSASHFRVVYQIVGISGPHKLLKDLGLAPEWIL